MNFILWNTQCCWYKAPLFNLFDYPDQSIRIFRLQELSGEQLNTLDQHVLAVPAQGAGGHPSEPGCWWGLCLTGSFMSGLRLKYSKNSSRSQVSYLKYFLSVDVEIFTSQILSVSSVLSHITVLKMMLVSWCWPARRRPPSSRWETSVRGSGARI